MKVHGMLSRVRREQLSWRRVVAVCGALGSAAGVAGCGKSLASVSAGFGSGSAAAASSLSPTTDPATSQYNKPVVWAMYRDVETLDPVQAFDYPEQTVVTALCDSLQRQNPDGTISPGLAVVTYPNPTTMVLNLRYGVHFWDGHPVTSADVVFSLERAASATSGSFYSAAFARVKSIEAASSTEVVIHLKRPDYWLQGEFSQMAGVVVEKSYVEKAGKKFGSPQGKTMCTGPYEVKSWVPGKGLTVVKNPNYWDSTLSPLVKEYVFKGVATDAALTAGLETDAIQGSYPTSVTTIAQLMKDKNLTVSFGPSFDVDAMVISATSGPLTKVAVRQAISMAIDREAYIEAVYHGHALIPRAIENPGTWGYAKSVFQANWDSLPQPTVNIAKAKAMIKAAGVEGETITIGTTQETQSLATAANLVGEAATSIGLKVKYDSVSAQNYINFFESASARKGVDMFPTNNYGDYADPSAFYKTFVSPGGSQNYDNFSNAAINKLMSDAQSSANPVLRAKYTTEAGNLIMQQLPWIPLAAAETSLVTQKNLTGAPSSFVYMGGPWANMLGQR